MNSIIDRLCHRQKWTRLKWSAKKGISLSLSCSLQSKNKAKPYRVTINVWHISIEMPVITWTLHTQSVCDRMWIASITILWICKLHIVSVLETMFHAVNKQTEKKVSDSTILTIWRATVGCVNNTNAPVFYSHEPVSRCECIVSRQIDKYLLKMLWTQQFRWVSDRIV